MEALTRQELQSIVYTVLGEAAGEGNSGMAAVTHIILNRANDRRFPDNPADVATQHNDSGVYQFSAWNTKALAGNDPISRYPTNSPTFRRAELVVKQVLAGGVPDYTYGATHYWSPRGMGGNEPYWATAESTTHGRVKIGGHIFLARKPVVPIPPSDLGGVAGAVSERAYLRRYAALPNVSAPIVVVNPPMPKPRPVHVQLYNATKRLPDLNHTTMNLGAMPSGQELKAWQSAPQATLLTTRKVSTVAIDFVTGIPKSPLQVATERKAAEMAAARVPVVSNGVSSKPAIVTQRQEQEAQRRAAALQIEVRKEASRIALERATTQRAAERAPTKAIELAVADIAATPRRPSTMTNIEAQRLEQQRTRAAPAKPSVSPVPASNGRSAQSNITTAQAEQAAERVGQKLQVDVNRVAAEIATGRKVAAAPAFKPPGGSASDRVRQAQSPNLAAIPELAVVKAEPPKPASYTIPTYGPKPVPKKDERLAPDAPPPSPLLDPVGEAPKFGDLSVLRAKVAPVPFMRPTVAASPRKVAPKPADSSGLEALRARQAARQQQQIAQQAQQEAARRATPNLRIVVSGANPISAVEALKQQGYTSAQAYDMANAAARGAPSLEDRITGRAYERSSNNSSLSSI